MKHRWLYPAHWEALALACKEAAGWRCQHCGVAHRQHVVNVETGEVRTVYLHAAHLDHDPWNPAPRLMALCPSCHGRYDWSWQQRERRVALERLRHQVWPQRHAALLSISSLSCVCFVMMLCCF